MASQILSIHSMTPEMRKIGKVVEMLKNGAVILYPTDTNYALGCQLSNKEAISRIRAIRNLPEDKALTFICDSLSHISEFAKVSNTAYKTIKRLIPGPFTFILPASKMVPKFAQDAKRRTAGLRVPDNPICLALIKELGTPLISITAKTEDYPAALMPFEIIEKMTPWVDVVVQTDDYSFTGESTVIDMTTDEFFIMRHGAGIGKVLEYVEMNEEA